MAMFEKIRNMLRSEDGFANTDVTVLVVEDNEVDRTVISRTVQKLGYRVIEANDGIEGLKMAKAEKPNLILLDCAMPKMDGLEMCRKIREDTEIANTSVVFITSVDTPKNIIECFDMDAENYLSKPVSGKVLTDQIKIVLKEHQTSL